MGCVRGTLALVGCRGSAILVVSRQWLRDGGGGQVEAGRLKSEDLRLEMMAWGMGGEGSRGAYDDASAFCGLRVCLCGMLVAGLCLV